MLPCQALLSGPSVKQPASAQVSQHVSSSADFRVFPQTGTVGVLSSEEKGTRLAGWVARFGWVARGFGAGGPRSLGVGWVAGAGARGFGWLARGSGAGGLQHAVVFEWLACSSGAGGSHSLDGRHAAQELGARMEFGWHVAQELGELGARGVWMGGTRLWSRAPAVLMHVPGTFNIDGLSAGWVTACTHTC